MTPGERPLAGRSILVTRNPGDWADLARRLEAEGARALFRSPTVQVEPEDASAVRAAVERIERYAWIAVTSGKGARFLADALGAGGRSLERLGPRLAAVGPGTARVLGTLGRGAELVAEETTGAGLARALVARIATGERVLVVRPEGGSSAIEAILAASGVSVDAVPFYRTVPAPWAGDLASSLAEGRFDAIVVTAPSALREILSAAGALREPLLRSLARMRRVAIGPTSARALEESELPADAIAEEPTEEAVLRALRAALGA